MVVDEGVIVGSDRNQEWLLPWWWMNFRLHNNHPVAFVDFGDMSPSAVSWCQKRGPYFKLNPVTNFVAQKEFIDPQKAALWEKMHPTIWSLRLSWYKKPFALQMSPFKRSLWLDVDCQVRGSIEPLFALCENEAKFSRGAGKQIFTRLKSTERNHSSRRDHV